MSRMGTEEGTSQVHGLGRDHPLVSGNSSRTSTLATLRTHYAILGVSQRATPAEIRTAYRSLILLHHPDRVNSFASSSKDIGQRGYKVEGGAASAEELNAAWEVLGDAHSREEYDQVLERNRGVLLSPSPSQMLDKCTNEVHAATHVPSVPLPTYALIISLDMFTPHWSSSTPTEHSSDDPDYYTYPCRCSSAYVITLDQLEDGVEVIQCGGCSERCLVEYEVDEGPAAASDEPIHDEAIGGVE
jgi:diphthamide biosynthesis protein 4